MSVENLLQTEGLTIKFGGVTAVDHVSIAIKAGQIFGLIGPNGAGKTTMFNLLTNIYKPTSGKVFYKGRDLSELQTHEITSLGISRTFQNIRLLKEHTVFENIMIATHGRVTYRFIDSFFKRKSYRRQEEEAAGFVYELMKKYHLYDLKDEIATDLPQGVQRKIEIVRALATGAELIFLDEPAAGLNPVETIELMELIESLQKEGKTIFLIEHDMKLVRGVCDQIAVLHFGQLLDQGTYEQVTANPKVVQAYLGRRYQHAEN
ncbi:ABC transporter ATP-binding protein [Ammoniphilus sp. CFH 90114]|uniref:ABC transporter ATP-binding protein n=1 Tax=Ammoniphilus sp. CFH 90114 TaxID=2493665 RepID=UPI00100DB66A|nr:ABC transporter ATP-binding protein [Ammoniphilus sp. CFH 90114]RXT02387.1 ABC transporter ATP-binding protein [Ammoniphilus sp. CFH 90114]